MNKIILYILIFISVFIPNFACAENELPSETGIVKAIQYVDIPEVQQGNGNVKQIVKVEIKSGEFYGEEILTDNVMTGNPSYDIPLKKGDKVILHTEKKSEEINTPDDLDYYIADIKRDNTLWILAGIFFASLIIIGRKKGVSSFISIISTILLIFFGLIPMILNGISPILATAVIGIISTIITIYLVGGINYKSTSAIIGTGFSIIIAGLLSGFTITAARLTGFVGEESMFLYTAHPELNFKGILTSAMLIAALGALMDTSISIASTINEIYETNSNLTIKQLFRSGMNVGKDIIGTMSNTLILVYIGNSLPLALLSSNIDMQKFFNLNQVATEISSALVGSIAILLCVPITAIIASFMIKKNSNNTDFNFEE